MFDFRIEYKENNTAHGQHTKLPSNGINRQHDIHQRSLHHTLHDFINKCWAPALFIKPPHESPPTKMAKSKTPVQVLTGMLYR